MNVDIFYVRMLVILTAYYTYIYISICIYVGFTYLNIRICGLHCDFELFYT